MQVAALAALELAKLLRERLRARDGGHRCRGRGRGPRSTARSSAAMARACEPSGAPSRISGCLSSASSVTGGRPSIAASAASRANTPAGVSASASPPESSTVMLQRASAASTRRASARSGVTSAAVLPSSSIASRSAMAIASASSSGCAASIEDTVSSAPPACAENPTSATRSRQRSLRRRGGTPRRRAARGRGCWAAQAAPRRRARSRCARAAPAGRTADGRERRGLRRRPRSWSQDGSSSSVSRPGSTTAPCGSLAMVAISSAVAGIEPVEPAAITGPSLWTARRRASAAIRRSRRAAGSIVPRSARMAGHASRAILQELQRELPVLVETDPAPAGRAAPTAPGASSCRPSGARDRRRARARRPGWWRPAAHDLRRAAPATAPSGSPARRAAAAARARRSPAAGRARLLRHRGLRERDLVLVDVAERHDARQDRGVGRP